MSSFSTVTLLGRLTRDCEIRYIPSGAPVLNASIAVNRRFKQGDEAKDEVSYFELVAWNKTAELLGQYTKKGDLVLVHGYLQQRRWEKDGEKKSKVEVVVERVTFMPKGQSGGGTLSVSTASAEAVDDGDIPF